MTVLFLTSELVMFICHLQQSWFTKTKKRIRIENDVVVV